MPTELALALQVGRWSQEQEQEQELASAGAPCELPYVSVEGTNASRCPARCPRSLWLQMYEDALQLEDGCLQALFNAGLACRALGMPERALALMQQLLHATPGHAVAMWQAGDLCDELGDTAQAVEWLTRLLTKAPHDSGVLVRLGALHAK